MVKETKDVVGSTSDAIQVELEVAETQVPIVVTKASSSTD